MTKRQSHDDGDDDDDDYSDVDNDDNYDVVETGIPHTALLNEDFFDEHKKTM